MAPSHAVLHLSNIMLYGQYPWASGGSVQSHTQVQLNTPPYKMLFNTHEQNCVGRPGEGFNRFLNAFTIGTVAMSTGRPFTIFITL